MSFTPITLNTFIPEAEDPNRKENLKAIQKANFVLPTKQKTVLVFGDSWTCAIQKRFNIDANGKVIRSSDVLYPTVHGRVAFLGDVLYRTPEPPLQPAPVPPQAAPVPTQSAPSVPEELPRATTPPPKEPVLPDSAEKLARAANTLKRFSADAHQGARHISDLKDRIEQLNPPPAKRARTISQPNS